MFLSHTSSFVIVNNFNVERIPFLPTEADPPSVVYADAVLSFSILFQCFEAIARRHCQIPQNTCAMQIKQLAAHRSLKSFESCYSQIAEQVLGFFAFEGLNHRLSILRIR